MKIDLHALRTELLEEELLLLGKKKIKRFSSSGISGHSKSGRTQTKLNGHGGMSLGPLRRDRRAVQVLAFTSFDSKNYDCLQPPVRKVLTFMLYRLTVNVRHASSEPPAKAPLLTKNDVNACEVRPPPAVHDCHGRRSRQETRRCRSPVTKKHRRCSRRKSSINIAARSCQAGGSGEGAWSRRVALHKACMGVQVRTGTGIHWDAHQTFFFVRKSREGESKQIFQEYGFKKTSKITDDPLTKPKNMVPS